MKKKILFGACAALFLGVGAVTASHFSGNGLFGGLVKGDVESVASCEVSLPSGIKVGECFGSQDECSIPLYSGTVLKCSGSRSY